MPTPQPSLAPDCHARAAVAPRPLPSDLTGSPVYLGRGNANDLLPALAPGSARLVVTSPRYLDLIDYAACAQGVRPDRRTRWFTAPPETVADYTHEHLETAALLHRALADDGLLALEIDDIRDPATKSLVVLPDLWRDMLAAVGFTVLERIRLVRQAAHGRRSGHFIQRPRPGYFMPDSVVSELVICAKGDPLARLRRDGDPSVRLDIAWARQYLTNAWRLKPLNKQGRLSHHPVPFDPEMVRALITLYSLPGDLVIDPFAGGGTVGREAAALGRPAVLLEREPPFADEIAHRLDARPLEHLLTDGLARPRVQVQGAQLALPMAGHHVSAIAEAYQKKAAKDLTLRLRQIAAIASAETGVAIPPELVSVLLRAEREHCGRVKSARMPRDRDTPPRARRRTPLATTSV